MLRRFRVLCIHILAVVLLGACASTAPIRTSDLDKVIRDAERKARMVNQFQADFVKTRKLWVFNRKMTARGRLIVQKPSRFWMTLRGDVNVDILSDGKYIKVTHGKSDQEVYAIQGDRDLTRFADPLMLLIDSIETGGFRKFSVGKTVARGSSLVLEVKPGYEFGFDKTEKILLTMTAGGEVRKVTILYKNGDVDETRFTSWALLDADAPEISHLNKRLRTVGNSSETGITERGGGDQERMPVSQTPGILGLADNGPLGTTDSRAVR